MPSKRRHRQTRMVCVHLIRTPPQRSKGRGLDSPGEQKAPEEQEITVQRKGEAMASPMSLSAPGRSLHPRPRVGFLWERGNAEDTQFFGDLQDLIMVNSCRSPKAWLASAYCVPKHPVYQLRTCPSSLHVRECVFYIIYIWHPALFGACVDAYLLRIYVHVCMYTFQRSTQ